MTICQTKLHIGEQHIIIIRHTRLEVHILSCPPSKRDLSFLAFGGAYARLENELRKVAAGQYLLLLKPVVTDRCLEHQYGPKVRA